MITSENPNRTETGKSITTKQNYLQDSFRHNNYPVGNEILQHAPSPKFNYIPPQPNIQDRRFIFFQTEEEAYWNDYYKWSASFYGGPHNNVQQQYVSVYEDGINEATEKRHEPNLKPKVGMVSAYPTDKIEVQLPDIDTYNVKMAELCEEEEEHKIEEPDEKHHENIISNEEKGPKFHPIQAAIIKALKGKLASGIGPKEAFVKSGDIRKLFPGASRRTITRHLNALLQANRIERVGRIKYYLISNSNIN